MTSGNGFTDPADAPTVPDLKIPAVSIVQAAIRKHGVIFTLPRPARHLDIELIVEDAQSGSLADGEHGFLTNGGQFVDRVRAALIAIDAGQVNVAQLLSPPLLHSEDLW